MQSGDSHQLSKSSTQRVIPSHYNPSEDINNINELDKIHLGKLKKYVTRVTCSIPGSLYTARGSSLAVNDRNWAFEQRQTDQALPRSSLS